MCNSITYPLALHSFLCPTFKGRFIFHTIPPRLLWLLCLYLRGPWHSYCVTAYLHDPPSRASRLPSVSGQAFKTNLPTLGLSPSTFLQCVDNFLLSHLPLLQQHSTSLLKFLVAKATGHPPERANSPWNKLLSWLSYYITSHQFTLNQKRYPWSFYLLLKRIKYYLSLFLLLLLFFQTYISNFALLSKILHESNWGIPSGVSVSDSWRLLKISIIWEPGISSTSSWPCSMHY